MPFALLWKQGICIGVILPPLHVEISMKSLVEASIMPVHVPDCSWLSDEEIAWIFRWVDTMLSSKRARLCCSFGQVLACVTEVQFSSVPTSC